MPVSDFYPFKPNQKVTAEQWNLLLKSIQDGTFFLDVEPIASQLYSLSARVAALESRVTYLEGIIAYRKKRIQRQLTQHQTVIELEDVPRTDSEIVCLNGTVLSKSDVPLGFAGDYVISNNVITLSAGWEPQIEAGDMFVVTYDFEVAV